VNEQQHLYHKASQHYIKITTLQS